MKYYIYCLEFEDGRRYIGVTKNVAQRMGGHRSKFDDDFEHFVLEEADETNALLMECMWMQLYRTWGFNVINEKPFKNVDVTLTPDRPCGRKPVNDKRVQISLYPEQSIVDQLGKEKIQEIAIKAVRKAAKK